MIVEDSVTQREIFRRLLENDPELTVVAEARDGREAITQTAAYQPDVVLMDIHMPDMDGITATAEIMRICPTPIVVASATLKKRDVDLAMKAYEAGAVSVIEKPEGAVLLHLQTIGPKLRRELIAAAVARVRENKTRTPAKKPYPRAIAPQRISAIGLVASTGGPPVLLEILSALPAPFPIPILLVQHISHGFEDGFARWLSNTSGHQVKVAEYGQLLGPGVWVAPGGRHLSLRNPTRMQLVPGDPGEIHCPSGDALFYSLAEILGPRAAGVLLTGMGGDGAAGLLALKQAGGLTIIQDEESSLIWGMPKTAQQLGAASLELPPEGIAEILAKLSMV
ncbi:chemotaxis protein CheB [Lignipirellula cremea]|uniref:chemotaxis protein CheB n=1 Tax=Lignipirellula cremea TaxID=2528010 RepID=UPI0018D26CDD|nr:chemotaxis protein CheB [Lignipirellula cremea]